MKTESILKNSHKVTTKEAILYIIFVSDDLHVFEPLNIGMYIYMKLTHTENIVFRHYCCFSFGHTYKLPSGYPVYLNAVKNSPQQA